MYTKTFAVKLLSIVLASAFLVGSFPMPSHMSSMGMVDKMVSERAVPQINPAPGNVNNASSGSCCDAMSPYSLTCDFLFSQLGSFAQFGDSEQVVNLDPIIQSIYIKAASPPPKA